YRPSPLRRGGLPQPYFRPYFRREPALTTFFVPGEGFLVAVFLAVLFFAVGFLAVVFLAVVFFAVDFLVVFFVAPPPSAACFARRSANSSCARSSLRVSGESPSCKQAQAVPSVT